jgi:DNA topoisomerase-1
MRVGRSSRASTHNLSRPAVAILATVVWIIDQTLMRVGNEEYARANDSYGATTLRKDHVEVRGAEVVVSFRGKHGKEHRADFRDRRIAAVCRSSYVHPDILRAYGVDGALAIDGHLAVAS